MISAVAQPRTYRLSGMLPQGDKRFAAQSDPEDVIAPIKVPIPGGKYVPQYAPTVVGTENRYDPAGDCDGAFMSSKFQPNNNCYNYACDIATNSFAQPGRKHGILLGGDFTGEDVEAGANADGLVSVSHEPLTAEQLQARAKELGPGHFAALLISQPKPDLGWPGDYHWVRCDSDMSWSQKDGTDQITNFDYAGHPISDPAAANWTVNEGPLDGGENDVIVKYDFHAIMFVPDGKVDII